MANVFIDENILQGWADTVREKTGTTDKMLPSALLQQTQDNWGTGGGGAVGDATVKYVTFLNENGATLYQMPVLVGDDCKDPVIHGDIDAPTKESTNTQVFTRSGWTSTVGGTADADILKNITEDKTVYAAYAVSVRYYTVTFYDADNTTVLNTMQVEYGADVSDYIPEKKGYSFEGWTPLPNNVTSDMDCYASWTEGIRFATASWATIAEISEAGTAADTFAIGDEKTISFGDETVTVQIAGFNIDTTSSDGTTAGISIVFKDIPSTCVSQYNSSSSSIKMYDASDLNTFAETVYNSMLPTDLTSVIKNVQKTRDYSINSSSKYTMWCYVFALSNTELGISASYSNTLGSQYPLFTSSYNGSKICKTTGTSTAVEYWTRGVRCVQGGGSTYSAYKPFYVTTGGASALSTSGGNETKAVRLGFCV